MQFLCIQVRLLGNIRIGKSRAYFWVGSTLKTSKSTLHLYYNSIYNSKSHASWPMISRIHAGATMWLYVIIKSQIILTDFSYVCKGPLQTYKPSAQQRSYFPPMEKRHLFSPETSLYKSPQRLCARETFLWGDKYSLKSHWLDLLVIWEGHLYNLG